MPSDCPKAPDPGSAAPALHTALLPARTRLVRFQSSSSAHPVNSFNPNTGKDWTKGTDGARFNPFPDAKSVNVPTIYAADTFAAAALESVFHAVPHVPSPDYLRSQLGAWCYAELQVTRDLTIFMLTNPELRQLRVPGRTESLEEAELIHSQPEQYPQTRTWARFIHAADKSIQGLGWRPRLGGQGISYVLFGDRRDAKDLKIAAGPFGIDDGAGFARIAKVARNASIRIIAL